MPPSSDRRPRPRSTWLLDTMLGILLAWTLVRPVVWALRQFIPLCLWMAEQPAAAPVALPVLSLFTLVAGFLLGYLPMRLLSTSLAARLSAAERRGREDP